MVVCCDVVVCYVMVCVAGWCGGLCKCKEIFEGVKRVCNPFACVCVCV